MRRNEEKEKISFLNQPINFLLENETLSNENYVKSQLFFSIFKLNLNIR